MRGPRALGARLAAALRPSGLDQVAELTFRRPADGPGAAVLLFPCRHDRRGFFAFGCNVGVRFDVLEPLLGDEGGEPGAPTIVLPLHLLEPGGRHHEWSFERQQDLDAVVPDVVGRVRAVAVPWWEKHTQFSAVRQGLESDLVADWLGADPERRVCLLAAIDVAESDRTGAIERLERALHDRAGGPPKVRYPLEDVLRRIRRGWDCA